MLKKALISFTLAAAMAATAVAQARSVDDYKKGEFYVGYSNGQVDTGIDSGNSALDFFRDRENFNGVNVAGVYNLNRYFGVKGDVSATYNSNDFSGTFPGPNGNVTLSGENKNSLYNFTGGVQVKDNTNEGRFKPFAHALIGVGHIRSKLDNFSCTGTDCPTFLPPTGTLTDTGFSAILGGGIDFRLNNRIQIRAIQIDYNPVRVEGATLNNVRIGAGIVF